MRSVPLMAEVEKPLVGEPAEVSIGPGDSKSLPPEFAHLSMFTLGPAAAAVAGIVGAVSSDTSGSGFLTTALVCFGVALPLLIWTWFEVVVLRLPMTDADFTLFFVASVAGFVFVVFGYVNLVADASRGAAFAFAGTAVAVSVFGLIRAILRMRAKGSRDTP